LLVDEKHRIEKKSKGSLYEGVNGVAEIIGLILESEV
jgi:hypothetical protein